MLWFYDVDEHPCTWHFAGYRDNVLMTFSHKAKIIGINQDGTVNVVMWDLPLLNRCGLRSHLRKNLYIMQTPPYGYDMVSIVVVSRISREYVTLDTYVPIERIKDVDRA
ncbi:MAG: hypothetical protein EPN75_08875 [Beijerinckiaceae bacterium]|nr:MAG: hypothetical protein EPN75_08875 [Beijerinckiaceae bacterium]